MKEFPLFFECCFFLEDATAATVRVEKGRQLQDQMCSLLFARVDFFSVKSGYDFSLLRIDENTQNSLESSFFSILGALIAVVTVSS